jgi:AcrR family transcriptional regulator
MANDTRDRILDAALACFLELGYEQTTIALVRERSGASNGALFHHFPTKDALADALYLDAIASFQEGLWELLERQPRSLRVAVRGVISHQIEWIEKNVDRARFVYIRGSLDWETAAGAELEQMNRRLSAAFSNWMAPLVESGRVRPMSMLLVNAIVTGPVHSLGQRWLAGGLTAPLHDYVEDLADAACSALTGKPARGGRKSASSAAREGRLRLQLVSGDGEVLAEGEATAALEPARVGTAA